MDMRNFTDAMFDAGARIDMMWPFPLWNGGEEIALTIELMADEPAELPDPFPMLVEGWTEDDLDVLFDGPWNMDSFAEALDDISAKARRMDISGYLAKVSIPRKTYLPGGSHHLSWGDTWHKLFFGKDLAELAAKVVQWVDKQASEDRQASLSQKGDNE